MKSFFIFFYLLFIHWGLLKGQTLSSNVNIKTPEVSAFNKNIETPVSLYSGTANVNIPLFNIIIKGVSVPITLDYNTGGIRVDQDATFVGLGWKLNYGGEISRKVKGIPDERYFINAANNSGSVSFFNSLPFSNAADFDNRIGYISQAKDGLKDFMPDEFYYSALESSGKFMFSQLENKFILFPKDDIDVQADDQSLNSWTLKMANGVQANFGQNAIVTQDDLSGSFATKNEWLIKGIQNTSNQSITYSYEAFNYSLKKLTSVAFAYHQAFSGSGFSGPTENVGFSQFNYHDVRISSISFPEGVANFIWSTRDDMPTKKLSEINITNSNGVTVKRILFNYSYFYGNTSDILPVLGYSDVVPAAYRYKRLRLDNVQVIGTDGKSITHSFNYYENTAMPCKYSYAQDHWGYFNAAANDTKLSFIPNIAPEHFAGGDRRVNPSVSNVFALKSVTYPEGGKTEFEYENNEAGIWNIPHNLLETYQDINIIEKQESIFISGPIRSSSYPSPTYTSNGVRYFTKQFTIPDGSFVYLGNGWDCYTNFGISAGENNIIYGADNANFKLEKFESGFPVLVKDFNTTSQYFPCTPACPRQSTDQRQLFITPGTYKMTVALTYSNPEDPNYTNPYYLNFIIKWREIDQTKKSIYTGGLRIKNIKYYTDADHLAKQKSYKYINPEAVPSLPEFTSGRVVSFPQYYQYKFRRTPAIPAVILDGVEYSISYCSNSILPLESTCGSYSGYEYVDEYDVDNSNSSNNLRTNYRFSFLMPYFSQYFTYLNLQESAEWTRGKLLSKTFFKNTNFVRKEDYVYYNWSPHLSSGDQEDYVQEISTNLISQSYLGYLHFPQLSSPVDFYENQPALSQQYNFYGFNFCINYHYGVANYNFSIGYGSSNYPNIYCQTFLNVPYFLHYTAFDKLKTKTISTRDDNGNNIVETENYYYDKTPNLHQLTRTESVNSKGESLSARITYPVDYSPASPYNEMLQRHILNSPIEQSLYKNGTTFLQSTKTNFHDWANNIIAPINQFEQQGIYTPEIKMQVNAYDEKGNILELQKANDVKKTYIWGYNKTYPVAEVAGVSYSSLIGVLNQAVLDNPADDAAMRSELNKIRINFPSALATTFTYKRLVGMTSQTDVNNRTTYNEYDAFGRLSLIRDKDNNILKKICYNYAGQPEDCGIPSAWNNIQKSGAFTKNNCGSGYVGTSVTYTVAELAYNSTVSQAAADQLAQNDVDANGQNYANTTGTCISSVCGFTAMNLFASPSSGFYNGGSNVSGYLVFYSTGTLTPGNSYQVGYVNGACKPAGTRTFSSSSGGRTYNFTIDSNGQLTVQLASGSSPLNPYSTVSISFSYNL
ncbi:MAG: DUF5977 domain-containing protein [Bacteroidota bacterium]